MSSALATMRRLVGYDVRWPGFEEDVGGSEPTDAKLSKSLDKLDSLFDQVQKTLDQASDELRPHGRTAQGDVGSAVNALHTALAAQASEKYGYAASYKTQTAQIRALMKGAKPSKNLAIWKGGW